MKFFWIYFWLLMIPGAPILILTIFGQKEGGVAALMSIFGSGLMILIARHAAKMKDDRYISDENKFSQAGVEVKYSDGVINIQGKDYPISAVRELSWLSDDKMSTAKISLDDINNPFYEIQFFNHKQSEIFIERLSVAVSKAGGSF